jgi:flagellar hook assembly protein FlgD
MIRRAAIVLMASLLVSNIASAQDTKLIDLAKKEGGKITAYGSLESNTVEPIITAFQKKTGLTVEYWRASATKVMDRALGELRAGQTSFRCHGKQQRGDPCNEKGGDVCQIYVAFGDQLS